MGKRQFTHVKGGSSKSSKKPREDEKVNAAAAVGAIMTAALVGGVVGGAGGFSSAAVTAAGAAASAVACASSPGAKRRNTQTPPPQGGSAQASNREGKQATTPPDNDASGANLRQSINLDVQGSGSGRASVRNKKRPSLFKPSSSKESREGYANGELNTAARQAERQKHQKQQDEREADTEQVLARQLEQEFIQGQTETRDGESDSPLPNDIVPAVPASPPGQGPTAPAPAADSGNGAAADSGNGAAPAPANGAAAAPDNGAAAAPDNGAAAAAHYAAGSDHVPPAVLRQHGVDMMQNICTDDGQPRFVPVWSYRGSVYNNSGNRVGGMEHAGRLFAEDVREMGRYASTKEYQEFLIKCLCWVAEKQAEDAEYNWLKFAKGHGPTCAPVNCPRCHAIGNNFVTELTPPHRCCSGDKCMDWSQIGFDQNNVPELLIKHRSYFAEYFSGEKQSMQAMVDLIEFTRLRKPRVLMTPEQQRKMNRKSWEEARVLEAQDAARDGIAIGEADPKVRRQVAKSRADEVNAKIYQTVLMITHELLWNEAQCDVNIISYCQGDGGTVSIKGPRNKELKLPCWMIEQSAPDVYKTLLEYCEDEGWDGYAQFMPALFKAIHDKWKTAFLCASNPESSMAAKNVWAWGQVDDWPWSEEGEQWILDKINELNLDEFPDAQP